jgi:hypothetical protein
MFRFKPVISHNEYSIIQAVRALFLRWRSGDVAVVVQGEHSLTQNEEAGTVVGMII